MYSLVYYLVMPVTRSAAKKLRQDKKREIQNLTIKRAAKDAIKKYERSPSPAHLSRVFSLLDSGRKKHIFHANKVARLKSRLTKKLKGKSAPKTTALKTAAKKKSSPKKSSK